jgi:uncharacterized membrane protein YphA (DoxX/SURF4 family)
MKQHDIKLKDKFWGYRVLVVFRIALGLALFIKGIQFVQDKSSLQHVFKDSLILQEYFWLQTIIPWLNLLCGFFIIIGLYTRLSVLLQIPILIGAIVFVNTKKGVFAGESELAFSIVILVLLLFFLFEGAGPFSLDRLIRRDGEKKFYA